MQVSLEGWTNKSPVPGLRDTLKDSLLPQSLLAQGWKINMDSAR